VRSVYDMLSKRVPGLDAAAAPALFSYLAETK
jgi:hypothetical protein